MLKLKDLIQKAHSRLKQAGIEDVALNVDLLLAKVLHIDRTHLPLHWLEDCQPEIADALIRLIERRCLHEPLQYILEEWGFLDFQVVIKPGALIPRPETEEVYLALADIIKKSSFKDFFKFVDVGTGSGILGLAIVRQFNGATGFLSDISSDALAIAAENIRLQADSVKKRIKLIQADLLAPFSHDSLDVVVANLPYIPTNEISGLMPEIREFEPHLALNGGSDGLDLIRRLLQQAYLCLKNNGLLAFEHGHGQRKDILALLKKIPRFEIILIGNDLSLNERFFILRKRK